VNTSSEIKLPPRRRRGRYSNEFKINLVEACSAPGISVAAVALANGVNANLLRRWISESTVDHEDTVRAVCGNTARSSIPEFIQLKSAIPSAATRAPQIELRIDRGELRIQVSGSPVECAVFARALLG
jgi:transposase-like protein